MATPQIEKLARAACLAYAEDINSEPTADHVEDMDQFVENFWPLYKCQAVAVLQCLIDMDWPLDPDDFLSGTHVMAYAKGMLKQMLEE